MINMDITLALTAVILVSFGLAWAYLWWLTDNGMSYYNEKELRFYTRKEMRRKKREERRRFKDEVKSQWK